MADHAPRRSTQMPLGDPENLIEVVADHQHGQPLSLKPKMTSSTACGFGDAERGGRLVHENEFRPPRAGARDRHDLSLAAGERSQPTRRSAARFAMNRFSISPCVRKHRALVEHVQECRADRSVRGPDRHLPRRRDSRRAQGPDRRSRCPRARASAGEAKSTRAPSNSIVPASGRQHAADDLDQSRLARAVVADKPGDLAVGKVHARRLQSDDRAETLVDRSARSRRPASSSAPSLSPTLEHVCRIHLCHAHEAVPGKTISPATSERGDLGECGAPVCDRHRRSPIGGDERDLDWNRPEAQAASSAPATCVDVGKRCRRSSLAAWSRMLW